MELTPTLSRSELGNHWPGPTRSICVPQTGALLSDKLREELIEDVSAALSTYYDALSPRTVAEDIVNLVEMKLGDSDGIP